MHNKSFKWIILLRNKLSFNHIILFAIIFIMSSCSVKKDRFTARVYHRMNAHYNAYFNGRESYKESVKQINKAHQDNYMTILPVFKYGKEQDAQASASGLDKAITKSSIVIKRHSMVFKRIEKNPWVVESYLLIGKSNFYKQNYLAAKQTFEYVIANYKDYPAKQEAELWLARTYNQMKQFSKSQPQLDQIKNKLSKQANINFFNKNITPIFKKSVNVTLHKELPLVYADYFIQQENFNPAIEHLMKGVDVNRKNKVRARLYFILGQIYQKNGNFSKATQYYQKVLKSRPAYEMAFNARMNMAKCYDANSSKSRNIKKELLKMSKDIKNKEYLDQIYYALAEISLKEKNVNEAINYLKLSSVSSSTNNNQKALTYLKLASIYYDRTDYIKSSPYYDSTLTVLPADFPDYTAIKERKETLANLVLNLKTIQFEDSVQTLANMTERDRNSAIDKLISEYNRKENEKRQAEINKQINQTFYTNTTEINSTNSNSWYFYNPNAIKFGITDFVKRWGNRPLEDNWFISDKKQILLGNFDNNQEEADIQDDSVAINKKNFNPRDRKSYLANIPLSPEKMKASHQRIEQAFYNLGFLFNEGLYEFTKSAGSFEELIKRYPQTSHELSSYYELYKLYKDDLKNEQKAEYYKNLIFTKFPDSDYAMMLKDPDYAKHMRVKKDEASILYHDTYLAYVEAQYSKVIENSDLAMASFKGNELLPKFDMLKTLSIGKTKEINQFSDALKEITTKYPNHKVKDEAQNILNYLNKDNNTVEPTVGPVNEFNNVNKKAYAYTFDPEAIHFFIMVIDLKDVNIKDIKIAISDFNKDQFSLKSLNISSSLLGSDKHIVTVSNFDNKEEGLKYFNTIKNNKDIAEALKKAKFSQFSISADNYTALFKTKDLTGYNKFFEDKYLK